MIVRAHFASRIGALLLALLLVLPSAARADGPELKAEKTTVKAGAQLEFTGSDFTPNELVSIWLTGPDGVAIKGDYPRAAKNNDDESNIHKGDISGSIQIPAQAIDGTWVLTARDPVSWKRATLLFEVEAQSKKADSLAIVKPKNASKGDQITFTAVGFKKDEKVVYWATEPGNELSLIISDKIKKEQTKKADDTGTVVIRWTAPSDAPSGEWLFAIQSKKEDTDQRTLVVPFNIK